MVGSSIGDKIIKLTCNSALLKPMTLHIIIWQVILDLLTAEYILYVQNKEHKKKSSIDAHASLCASLFMISDRAAPVHAPASTPA